MSSSEQIECAAAEWLQRRDGESWTSADQQELEVWLRQTVAHRVAFLRLEAAWEHTLRLRALGAGLSAGTVPEPGSWRIAPKRFGNTEASIAVDADLKSAMGLQTASARRGAASRVRMVMLAGIASSVFAAGIYLALHPGQTYSTPVGGITSIPLTDGSRMTLNTDSAASIDMDRNARVVRLLKGEAYFEVVRAPDRPFVVQAGLREIIVLGTQFSVRRGNDALDVLVTEGQVRVQGGERSVVASAGQRVRVQQATEVVLSEPQSAIESAISWRTGYISLDDVPLAEAISEFNRYNIRKVQIRNAKIAELRVSGKFRSTNVESFVHLLRDHFGVQSRIGAQAIELGEPQSSHLPP